ncbi:hypothetical protein [Candidatus Palauibacter sp.]|uniref:hypothetical protein n=1 Tax=Candidatus Palauibacter sp. TaxID=3101350 RepID=UPI003B02827D
MYHETVLVPDPRRDVVASLAAAELTTGVVRAFPSPKGMNCVENAEINAWSRISTHLSTEMRG